MADDGNQTLSVPFTDLGSLGGTFRAILKKVFQKQLDDMLPATVLAVSTDRQFVSVRPQILVVGMDGSTTSRAKVEKMPVFTLGAGGYFMSWPIKAGDAGWIKANDRDISLYVQNANAESQPATDRLHSFSDAVFLPDAARQFALADEDKDNAVWSSLDGKTKITLGANSIKITHPTLVEVFAPKVTMSGDLDVKGTITGETDVLAGPDKISGKGHTHPVSGSETGEPNP